MELSPATKKPWLLMSLIFTVFTMIATFCGLAIWLILHQKSEGFQPLSKASLIGTHEVKKAIESGVRLDKKVSTDYVRTKVTVARFQSQGESYTAFRIGTPENCGELGCLHVIKPLDGVAINLQLHDIDPTVQMFKPSLNPKCFVVVQPQDGYQDFEICQKIL